MHKRELATEQLDVAIELFLSEKSFISALTLAGAAEEILGSALTHEGKEKAVEEKFSLAAYFEEACRKSRSKEYCEKQYKKEFYNSYTGINKIRNEAKHWKNKSESTIEADFKKSAKEMIIRACRNYDFLGLEQTELMISFHEWFYENEVDIEQEQDDF